MSYTNYDKRTETLQAIQERYSDLAREFIIPDPEIQRLYGELMTFSNSTELPTITLKDLELQLK